MSISTSIKTFKCCNRRKKSFKSKGKQKVILLYDNAKPHVANLNQK